MLSYLDETKKKSYDSFSPKWMEMLRPRVNTKFHWNYLRDAIFYTLVPIMIEAYKFTR